MLAPMFVTSRDGTQINYETTGSGSVALVCAHGWMGHTRWWDSVRDAFSSTYEVIALDLAGHGQSGTRATGSAQAYADDILAVAAAAKARRIVLVGHSMSGGYATLAAGQRETAALILVDTLKNLDGMPPPAQVDQMLAMYRADYPGFIANMMPKYLFSPQTPPAVVDLLTKRFLSVTGEVASSLLEPLYRFDVRAAAKNVHVPVRGIGGDNAPRDDEANKTYFADYAATDLPGCGHYPMLEQPAAFNAVLRATLTSLGL